MRQAGTGKKQSEIIIDFSGSSNRRAGIAAGAPLLNRNSRRQTRNVTHRRLLHLFKELTCVGTERLDIFSPALGINRIEGERAFTRAAYAGNYHQFIPWNAQTDVLEIVLRRPRNPNRFLATLRHTMLLPLSVVL